VSGLAAHWYRDSLVSRLLLPLSWLFCGLVALRRFAYRRGWRRTEHLPVPLIVVGNITVGGSGKTPFLVWLVEQLQRAGWKVGVISRGYGGRSPVWPREVTARSDTREVGDEPVLIATRTGVPLVVGPDRVAAARHLLAHHAVDVILSDDGLQHYRLGRDIEVAVIDQARGLGNRRCLPAGPLREPPARLAEVDCLVRHGDTGDMQLAGATLRHLPSGRGEPLDAWTGRRVHAVAGIGHPERFFQALRRAGLELVEHPFPDHYAFTAADLVFGDALPIVMTEKDAVKCRAFAGTPHWYLPVTAKVDGLIGEGILKRLNEVSMDKKLLEILVCPVCKGPLLFKREQQELICKADRLAYPIRDDIPVMLEEEARTLGAEEDVK
jgi:tetraacyldisaccharide 4'-kinase